MKVNPEKSNANGLASPEIEARLLATTIAFPSEAMPAAITGGIGASVFAVPIHAEIWSALLAIHSEGLPIDEALIAERMPRHSLPSLLEVTSKSDSTTLHVAKYIEQLCKMKTRRTEHSAAASLREALEHGDEEGERHARAALALAATESGSSGKRSMAQHLADALVRADEAAKGIDSREKDAISWGFDELDDAFKKMRRGELVIVAARPSVGKSSLLRPVVTRAALAGLHPVFFTLEEPIGDVLDKAASSLTRIPLTELHRAHPRDVQAFKKALEKIGKSRLCIFDDTSLAAMLARVQAFHSRAPVDLVVIDYLGLIDEVNPAKGENKTQAIERVTKALKRLAIELKLVVLVACQLNRGQADGNRVPMLSDLRDSGAIEQDADRVVAIHRPDECPITNMIQSPHASAGELPRYGVQLLQLKGRSVGTGGCNLFFRRATASFEIP
jgi:replicative DNA helicase